MAKRGQTYPYRVRYEWTTGIKGTIVASTLDEAELKADRIEGYGLHHSGHDVTVTIVEHATGAILETRNTAVR